MLKDLNAKDSTDRISLRINEIIALVNGVKYTVCKGFLMSSD
jgi:hypothetical protein